MAVHPKLTALLSLAAIAAAALLGAPPVLAHARYKSSIPRPGEVLATSPARVEVAFSATTQNVSGTYDIEVNRDRGASVSAGPAVVDESDRTRLLIPLQSGLTAGRYVVNWKNASDDDGDAASGAFSFYVNKQPTAVDLENDRQLELVGAEDETPAAGASPTSSSAGGTVPARTTGSGTQSPGLSAATPGPTPPAAADGDSGRRNLILIIGGIAVGVAAGFGAWQYTARRRT